MIIWFLIAIFCFITKVFPDCSYSWDALFFFFLYLFLQYKQITYVQNVQSTLTNELIKIKMRRPKTTNTNEKTLIKSQTLNPSNRQNNYNRLAKTNQHTQTLSNASSWLIKCKGDRHIRELLSAKIKQILPLILPMPNLAASIPKVYFSILTAWQSLDSMLRRSEIRRNIQLI